MMNAMTVDVEDYFQVSAFDSRVSRSDWRKYPLRVQGNTERVLSLLETRDIKATFFVLGWIAQHLPGLVGKIAAAGHEVASHGFDHRRVCELDSASFREDLVRTKDLLEDLTGNAVIGYRAPSYSIDATTPWAFDTLAETGHRYSSSIYPIRHDLYGVPDAPRFPFQAGEVLTEVPISTVAILGRKLPCGGGGYFRLLPYFWSRWALRRVNERDGRPTVFYFHPWEIDPDQPRLDGLSLKTRFRHYVNLNSNEAKLRRLLGDFSWQRLDQVLGLR